MRIVKNRPRQYATKPLAEMTPEERREYSCAATQRYRKRNPEYVRRNREAHRGYVLKRVYGMTVDEYDALLQSQDGECAICHATTANKRTRCLAVDHNHETGDTRGLLCANCNLIVGLCRESVDLLINAANYLAIWNDEKRLVWPIPDAS